LLHRLLGAKKEFQVVSGYRSPETNRLLAAQRYGVAKHSLHMQGKAIDIRLPEFSLSDVRKAALSMQVGANVDEVRRGIGSDSRIGKRFLFAGIGYGGSCFPKDVQALAKTAQSVDYDFKILKSVMHVNHVQKTKLLPAIKAYFNGQLAGKKIAVWGLAFKPYTDDIREAPSLENIQALLAEGAFIKAYDPEAQENVQRILGDSIEFGEDLYDTIDGADALLVVTEWPEFRTPEFEKIEKLLKNKVIFDGRNVFEPDQMEELGFNYYSIGRQPILSATLVKP
ncbi:MAG TPA: UDP binding domain-containing protein, partial [Catalimonadaceae bacterium]|nr:UDP binding domain-containing protein [Catalimonadaceae bacterium]